MKQVLKLYFFRAQKNHEQSLRANLVINYVAFKTDDDFEIFK